MTRSVLAACTVAFCFSVTHVATADAQSVTTSAPAMSADNVVRGTVRVVPRTGPIALDGRLDDEAWRAAPVATGFVQSYPREGGPADDSTHVRITMDESAVWIAARMFDREPAAIAHHVVRRDMEAQADYFEVGFDSNHDRRTGFIFRVSAANVQLDEYVFDDRRRDRTWDAVWASAVAFDSLGWTAELRIPLSQLRFRDAEGEQSWGINFARRRIASNEESHFVLVSRLQQGIVSQFGELKGVRAQSARRLELRPYVLGSMFRGTAEVGNPFHNGRDQSSRVGTDVRIGLGSSFTLDATINPDFGQVESDPAMINLTAFEQYYEERRPFFVEDAKIFDFSMSGRSTRLYYSRRLGRAPRGAPPTGALFTDVPASANILGAAKFTGRTRRGLSVGALVGLSEEAGGLAYLSPAQPHRQYMAEPRAEYAVARLRQDFNDGASTVGVIGTGLQRALPADGGFDFLPSTAFNGGIDWQHQWGDRTWAFSGYFAASHVRGDSLAMLQLQRSSTHYFQRPDYRGPRVDSSLRSMSGYDWRMTMEKQRGRHWTGSIWAAEVSPGFEINDVGFSTRQEVLDGGARVQYQEIEPGRWYRSYDVSLSTFHNWSHDALAGGFSYSSWGRAHVSGSVSVNSTVEFPNFWRLTSNVSWSPENLDRSGTRGGPLMTEPRSGNVWLQLKTDQRRSVSFQPSLSVRRGMMGSGGENRFGFQVNARPSSRLEVQVEPMYTRSTIGAQYVGRYVDPSYMPTFGARYLFGNVERRELALTTRLNLAVSPTLSFQMFVQPLLSAGDYSDYKQLDSASTYRFTPFEEGAAAVVNGVTQCQGGRTCVDSNGMRRFDVNRDGVIDYSVRDQDFNVRSLIGNAVLRWEYRPGSTLFLVWQRQQRSNALRGDFDIGRDWAALMKAPTDNTFLVKVSYWLPL